MAGHLLSGDDLKLSFDVEKSSKGDSSSQFEADSDGQVSCHIRHADAGQQR